MTRFSLLNRVTLLAALLFIGFATVAHTQTIITFDAPNSINTVPQAINVFGQITGYYQDANGHYPGFLRQRNGTFTSFEADQSVVHGATYVTDINIAGQIIGYIAQPQHHLGFLRQNDGNIVIFDGGATTTLSAALATEPAPRPCCPDGTIPFAINGLGQVAGTFGRGLYFGFLRQPDGTTINFNANPELLPYTIPQAINSFGQITGYFMNPNLGYTGFLRKSNGIVVRFDPLGSISTQPAAINLEGQIAGFYVAADGIHHGFLRKRNGTIVTFDPAGSADTQPVAINLKGQITGFYATEDGVYHGFLRKANGAIVSFDAPNAATAGTFPKDINDLGQIVGYYQDANSALHGFVRSAR